MAKYKDYSDRIVDTSKMTSVYVIDKALLAKIAKEGRKAKYPAQIAPEILANLLEGQLIVVLEREPVAVDVFGEPALECGPFARCQLLVELVGSPSTETWVDISPKILKSLPLVMTPIWPSRLPTLKRKYIWEPNLVPPVSELG